MMNKIFGIIILAIFIFACGEDNGFKEGNISVQIKIDSAANKKVVLERIPRAPKRIQLDTLELNENGEGSFSTQISNLGLYSVYVIGEEGEIKFIGQPGDVVQLNANAKAMYASAKIGGTAENNRFDSLLTFIKATKYHTDSLYKVFKKAEAKQMHYALKDEFEILYKKAKIKEENFAKNYINKNPNQFSNLIAIESLNPKRDRDYFLKVDSSLMADFPNNEDVISFHNIIEQIFATSVGKKAKNFTLVDINNEQVSLSDFKGKYVLLDFWATTCMPCIKEIPNLKKVKDALKDENFEIVSVCIDRNNPATIGTWKTIIEKNNANWVQLYDAEGMATVRNYQIKYFPTIFLIGPDGNILDTGNHIRGENTLNVIKSFMKDE